MGERVKGIGASEGVAVGRVFLYAPAEARPQRERLAEDEVEGELSRFTDAVERAVGKLEISAERVGGEEGAIFEAHIEIARDPELLESVEERVRALQSPEAAVLAAGEEYAALFEEMEDEYLAARADDVRDVARQIFSELTGAGPSELESLREPAVIVARSLAPSETARIPKGMALGFLTAEGSVTSHVSIMARSLGIPAVVGVGRDALQRASEASLVGLDGEAGYAVLNPSDEELAALEARGRELEGERVLLERYRHVEGRTSDGRRIEVFANLGSAAEGEDAILWGAEGVGLLRSEFLFMERDELPSEQEQYEAYRTVAQTFAGKPVIVRTIDVGGDKDLPGVDQPREENPFLGWRGIRMSLQTPHLFRPQLRALLRAAAHGDVWVMFPMVADVGELRAARKMVEECAAQLRNEGIPFAEPPIGVMVETPAAALCASELGREADFLSIGTNDLTQYTLAADRGNERLGEHLRNAGHPAVLRLVGMTCEAGREAGIPVGVCGEAGGDPALIPKLIELGVSELSMSPPSIPRAKRIISEL